MGFADAVGVVGVLLYLVSYFLLQIERLRFDDYSYLVINMLAAVLIIVSLVSQFNLSAFLVEALWVIISVVGIIRRRQRG
ncbi:MAG TPA: cyclic nucleotide-binding protein [Hyphomicrobium sp.]|nr:cyclic nucleotide-binding protein [Hyphomicrobium sp.]